MKTDPLNQEKRYFVAIGEYLRSVIEAWANENTMKLKDEPLTLDSGTKVYELDVQYNDCLGMTAGKFGVGYSAFVNGKRRIGGVETDSLDDIMCVLVKPEIRDR